MRKMFNHFFLYEINVEEYLKDKTIHYQNRINYAEVAFAIETSALFWNPAPAKNDNQEKVIFADMMNKKGQLDI